MTGLKNYCLQYTIFFPFLDMSASQLKYLDQTTRRKRMDLSMDGNPLSPNESLFPKKRPGRSIFIGHKMSLHLISEDMIEEDADSENEEEAETVISFGVSMLQRNDASRDYENKFRRNCVCGERWVKR